jgi:hypothetical protein
MGLFSVCASRTSTPQPYLVRGAWENTCSVYLQASPLLCCTCNACVAPVAQVVVQLRSPDGSRQRGFLSVTLQSFLGLLSAFDGGVSRYEFCRRLLDVAASFCTKRMSHC